MKTVVFAIILFALTTPLAAQWVKHPTPGIPRTADGEPNLTAPTPRTADGKPDLSGLWQRISLKYAANIAADLKPAEIQPWAEALVKQRAEDLQKDHMSIQCLPWGPSYSTSARKAKIVQTPGLILMLDEDLTYRQIFMDGRALETDTNPSWMGYSVGRWEGDTLVVESFGFNDRTWLDRDGHPHTEALRMTERYRRRDFGHMEIEITLNDPQVYARPWTVALRAELMADTDLLESVCNESHHSLEHWVGTTSDGKKSEVKVAPEILAKYAGIYEEQDFWGNRPHPAIIEVTVSDGALFAELKGREKVQLVAQSETTFSGFYGLGIKFVTDGQGAVTHLLEMRISRDYRFRRTR
ncbi:MAG: hypothetical protein DMG12_00850 [Acidobacteria bacterium]|nr:MAG: hypothetical protein DMG12_00850 [Acidobacteriota bacterium]